MNRTAHAGSRQKKRGVLPIAFEIKEFVKMETLLSRVMFKTIMVPLHT